MVVGRDLCLSGFEPLSLPKARTAISAESGFSIAGAPDSSPSNQKTISDTLVALDGSLRDLYQALCTHLMALGDDVQEKPLKFYVAFKWLTRCGQPKRPSKRWSSTRIESSALGQILRQLSSAGKLSSRAPELFAAALAERNRLAHSFYRQHNFRRNTDDGRAVMIADLDSIHSTLLDAYKAALAVSGIDLDSIVIDLPTKHVTI